MLKIFIPQKINLNKKIKTIKILKIILNTLLKK
jgi:hypothetical protein